MFPAGTTVVPKSAPATALASIEASTLVLLISLVLISVGLLAPTISG